MNVMAFACGSPGRQRLPSLHRNRCAVHRRLGTIAVEHTHSIFDDGGNIDVRALRHSDRFPGIRRWRCEGEDHGAVELHPLEIGSRIAMRQAADLHWRRPQLRQVKAELDVPAGQGRETRMRICHHVLVRGLVGEKLQHALRDVSPVGEVVGLGMEVERQGRLKQAGIRRPQ